MPDVQPQGGLAPELYAQLERVAARVRAAAAGGRGASAHSLVHEAWLRLAKHGELPADRGACVALAAKVMRSVAVDHARRRRAEKRGGAVHHTTLLDLGEDGFVVDLLALDEALASLAVQDARVATVVQLRFFGGLSVSETAEALGVSERTVKSDFRAGRAWLISTLELRE